MCCTKGNCPYYVKVGTDEKVNIYSDTTRGKQLWILLKRVCLRPSFLQTSWTNKAVQGDKYIWILTQFYLNTVSTSFFLTISHLQIV